MKKGEISKAELMPRKIEISHRTVIFTIMLLLGIWVLYQIRAVVLLVFVAVILMAALNPLVDRLEKARLPRAAAVAILYLVFVGIVVGALAGIIPPLVEQTSKLAGRIPEYLGQLGIIGFDQQFISSQLSVLGALPENILRFTVGLFSNVLALFTLLVITFYLLLERSNLKKYLEILFGQDNHQVAVNLMDEVEVKLGGWVRGELVLMTIVGLMVYVGLRLLGIEFALPLALLSGILEVVPNFGPVMAAVPGVLLGLSISPVTGLAVAAMYFLVQQFENSVIVPKVMQKSTGVNPLVTILALIVGYELAGVMGAILAVPMTLLVSVVAKQLMKRSSWGAKMSSGG